MCPTGQRGGRDESIAMIVAVKGIPVDDTYGMMWSLKDELHGVIDVL